MASLWQLGSWSWGADPQLAGVDVRRVASLLSVAAVTAFVLPNSVQITDAILRAVQERTVTGARLVSASMVVFGLLFGAGVVSIGRASPFLYFQF
jgi:hypothetical protein